MLKRRSNIPGFQEGGANIDPVSGNDVPVGSMPEEVRDDIDAKLSPGEFVISADVVRFIGLERLMKMRDEAKKGLQRMSDIGQMGNADEVGEASNGTYEDEGFESEIDDILGELDAEQQGRGVNEQTEVMMSQGGFMKSGTDLTKAPKNPVFDVRYYKNDKTDTVMYITHINGKPMTPVPEGYKEVTQEEAQKVGQKADEAAKASQTSDSSGFSSGVGAGGGEVMLDNGTLDFLANEEKTPGARDARMEGVQKTIGKVVNMLTPLGTIQRVVDAFKGPQRSDEEAAKIPIESRTGTPFNEAQSVASTAYSAASNSGLSEVAASKAAAAAVAAYNNNTSDIPGAINTGIVAGQAAQDQIDRGGGGDGGSGDNTPGPSPGGTPSNPGSGGIDDNFGMARGGLVNKRQYPAKKKRGKGLASAKS